MRGGERVEREEVFLGVLQELADLRDGWPEALEHLRHSFLCLRAVLRGEQLPQSGGYEAALGGPAVLVHIPNEMHGAARTRKDTLDRVLEPFMMIRDRQAHALQAARP